MPAAKTRNPQDATLRNIRALKARVTRLERHVHTLQRTVLFVLKTQAKAR